VLVLTRLESRVLSYLKRLRPASDEDADESEDPAQILLACSRTAAAADGVPPLSWTLSVATCTLMQAGEVNHDKS